VNYAAGISQADQRAIARAVKAAAESEHHRYRVGAAVVCSGRVVAAPNRFRNMPDVAPYTEQSVHAEVRAILRAPHNGRGGTLYVARLGKRDRLLASHPCARCMPLILEVGIKRIVWWDGSSWVSEKVTIVSP